LTNERPNTVVVKTIAFKKVIEAVFEILKSGKVLDAKTSAEAMKCSLGTANKWLNRMTNLGILVRKPVTVASGGIGARKYVYVRNNEVQIHYDYGLQQRLFDSLVRTSRSWYR
jgi:predicted transcriptional regulator